MQELEKEVLNVEDKVLSSEQTYDSALATMILRAQAFIVPLINEVFGESFTDEAKVKILNSKRIVVQIDGRLSRRETDTYLKLSEEIGQLIEKCYHIECETWYDKSIIVRIVEYSSAIAVDEAVVTKDGMTLNIPNSTVIFLRPNNAIPKKIKVTYRMPNGREVSYEVPTLQIRDYTLDGIIEKKLLLLLPFHLFRYANEFDEMEKDEDKRKKIGDELHRLEEELTRLLEKNEISGYQKLMIEDLLLRVSDKLTMRYEKIREGVDEIMSGYILRTRADEIKDEGRQEIVDLMKYLWNNGRGEEANKALDDKGILDRLLAEFKSTQMATS